MWANPFLVGLAHYRLHIPSCCQKSVQLLKRTSQLVPLGSAAKCIPSSESQLHTSVTERVPLESVIIAIVCMYTDIQLVWPTQHRNWSSDSRDILGLIKFSQLCIRTYQWVFFCCLPAAALTALAALATPATRTASPAAAAPYEWRPAAEHSS